MLFGRRSMILWILLDADSFYAISMDTEDIIADIRIIIMLLEYY